MNTKLRRATINCYYNDNAIFNFIKDNVSLCKDTVLDIGCGKMKYKKLFTDAGKKYIGLDLEEGKFSYSVKADLYWDGKTLPLSESSVDTVLLTEVLEHCEDPSIAINEAFRVMKKGGAILITIPFIYQLHGVPYDFHRMTPYTVEKLLSKFSNIKIQPSGSWDASLAQMIGIWITNRPMPLFIKRILRIPSILLFRLLLWMDKKSKYTTIQENFIMPGLLITAQK